VSDHRDIRGTFATRHKHARLASQEEIAKYGTIKEFQVVLWRQEPDTTGCNWNARIEYIGRKRAADARDLTWWDVVPQMRERFNLG
jgi:hypothetical protein